MIGRGRSGFMLIEVLVALVIGGMAVAGAGALFLTLSDRVETIERAAVRTDQAANAEQMLRGLVANLTFGNDSMPTFVGDSTSARFRAWCHMPEGWLDRCFVHLFLEQSPDGKARLRLGLEHLTPDAIVLRDGFRRGSFHYLVRIDGRLSWKEGWSALEPPAAVAVVVDGDTLLLPVWGDG